MDLRCIQRAEIRPECSILVLFVSWWGYLGVAMCFPMYRDQFRVFKVVRFEIQQKKSFLGLHTVVNWPYFGGVTGGGSDTNFFGLSIQFPHQLSPYDGKSSGPGRYLTFDTFWATLVCTGSDSRSPSGTDGERIRDWIRTFRLVSLLLMLTSLGLCRQPSLVHPIHLYVIYVDR